MRRSILSRIVSALTCLSICATTALAFQQPGTAVIKNIEGSATYVDSIGQVHPAFVGTTLHTGDTLQTSTASSVDVHLPETDATVGLAADSKLLFERLYYTETDKGRVTDTLLDLQSGELISKVGKQKPGSQFLVTTDKATTEVRGTEFFVDARSGDVHVTSGTVVVFINIDLKGEYKPRHGSKRGSRRSDPVEEDKVYSTRVTVKAGESLFIPTRLKDDELEELEATSTPWPYSVTFLDWLARHSRTFDHYQFEGNGDVWVVETFSARRIGGDKIWLVRPPEVEVVSP